MNKEFIISKLQELKIIDNSILLQYVEFCLCNNITKIKHNTAKHHILPKSLFPDYKDFKKFEWNCCILTHENHYIAHSMLASFIDDDKIIYAWNRLNNIPNDINIDSEIYHLLANKFAQIAGNHWINTIPTHYNGSIIRKNKEDITPDDKILFKDVKLVKSIETGVISWLEPNLINDSYILVMSGENHPNYGITRSDETKLKISTNRIINGVAKGKNNPRAKIFEIYNNFGELITVVHGDLKGFAKEYNIPFSSIRKCLDRGDGILYKDATRKSDISTLKSTNRYQYKNWLIKDISKNQQKEEE